MEQRGSWEVVLGRNALGLLGESDSCPLSQTESKGAQCHPRAGLESQSAF